MRGIKFQTNLDNPTFWHTADNWGLVMTSKSISVPQIKEKYIELKDRDGVLDYTDTLTGIPAYGTRTLSFDFEYLDDPKRWTEVFTEICGTLHGKRLLIFEPDDPDHYYTGRVSVGDPSGGLVKSFTITVKADTWRYPFEIKPKYIYATQVNAYYSVQNNGHKTVSPEIIADGAVIFTFEGTKYTIPRGGRYQFPSLHFKPGENKIWVSENSSTYMLFALNEGVI